jgi:tryptophan-rich sensory protein
MHYMIMSTVFTNPALIEQMKRQQEQQNQPAFDPTQLIHAFLWMYLFFGVIIFLCLVGNLASGLCLRRRRARMFSLVVGGVNCLAFPFGTALGVFTLIVLVRPTVTALYNRH